MIPYFFFMKGIFMKVDLFDISKFVSLNNLQAVTNPIYLNPDKTPTEDGIFSYNIFGFPGSRERKENFAYIELNAHVFHPFIYKQLVTMERKIQYIVESSKNYLVSKSGELIEDEENGYTGIEWLYKVWDSIKFKKGDSETRKTKLSILNKLSKNEIFVNKWIVMPAMYRDLNFANLGSGRISMEEINEYYIKILNTSKALDRPDAISFLTNSTLLRMQGVLVELYEHLISKPTGKNGYVRQYMIGKNIDYSARAVISTTNAGRAETYNDMEIPFSYIGLPIHIICGCFKPFVLKAIREIVGSKLEGKTKLLYGGKVISGDSINAESFSDSAIDKMITLFEKSQEDRFNTIYIEDEEGKKKELMMYSKTLERPMTIADLLFLACHRIIEDKHVVVTRYPIISHQSTNPLKIKIVSTEKTMTMDFDKTAPEAGKKSFYSKIENYPDINSKHLWRDAAIFDNNLTHAYGADFDGSTFLHASK